MHSFTTVVTRPREDAEPLAEILKERGHDVLIEPMLHIAFNEAEYIDVQGALERPFQAILTTSAYAIRALANATEKRDVTLVTVGEASALAARVLGFSNVISAANSKGGDVNILANYVTEHYKPDDGTLLYIAGSVQSADLQHMLEEKGFSVESHILYQSDASKELSSELEEQLSKDAVDLILFYSPRTLKIFTSIIEDHHLGHALEKVHAACFSSNIADIAFSLGWQNVYTSPFPTQDALLTLIDDIKSSKVPPVTH